MTEAQCRQAYYSLCAEIFRKRKELEDMERNAIEMRGVLEGIQYARSVEEGPTFGSLNRNRTGRNYRFRIFLDNRLMEKFNNEYASH